MRVQVFSPFLKEKGERREVMNLNLHPQSLIGYVGVEKFYVAFFIIIGFGMYDTSEEETFLKSLYG